MKLLPLDIAPDLTLTIGGQSTRVTPHIGMRLAESLLRVSVRQLAREEHAKVLDEADRRRLRPAIQIRPRLPTASWASAS